MKLLSSGVFWGLLLITIGVLAILRTVLNVNLPIFRIAIALFFIYIGVSILFGGFLVTGDRNTILFEERSITAETGTERYMIVFGSGDVDLSSIDVDTTRGVDIVTVFGSSRIIVKEDMPVRFKVSSVFGSASRPTGESISFGDFSYTTPGYEQGRPHLVVDASVVFGSLRIHVRK